MENHHFQWVNPLYMVIFNSYVKLSEGTMENSGLLSAVGCCFHRFLRCHVLAFCRFLAANHGDLTDLMSNLTRIQNPEPSQTSQV